MYRNIRNCSFALCLFAGSAAWAGHDSTGCGTWRGRLQEELHYHRQAVRSRARAGVRMQAAPPAATLRADVSGIAVIDDSDGVITRRNDFDLAYHTLTFTASGGSYQYAVSGDSYDPAPAAAGQQLALGDDDAAPVGLAFPFPFFGATYRQVYVNSDGNLTFGAADVASTERSLGRLTSGPPRIAPLFDDLNPADSQNGVYVLSEAGRLVVSWVSVPEYGGGVPLTFQARLFPDGRIEFAYASVLAQSAVVGLSPGGLKGATSVVDFTLDPSQGYAGTVAEAFASGVDVDFATVGQRFYANHEDAYDYLVIFNNEGIADSPNSYASTRTVRTRVTGTGDVPVDVGAMYGSQARLRAVINMGPLSQYPDDLTARMQYRPTDTPISVLAHEAGHLYLAYASIVDPSVAAPDPAHWPMLESNLAHWSFVFNSEASLLEGNRIHDNGSGANPRFQTAGATEGYSPLDQYLMGLRAPDDVPPFHPMFYVTGSGQSPDTLPRLATTTFNGVRNDVTLDALIAQVGRRVPDYTVAQKRYRFAFMLVLPKGTTPAQPDIDKINGFRQGFEDYYPTASACTGCRIAVDAAGVETDLKRAVQLSLAPAAGVLVGGSAPAAVTLQAPAQAALTITLASQGGLVGLPASVVIPAGQTRAGFTVTGIRAGVDQVTATPSDAAYETARVHVQVAATRGGLSVVVASGDGQAAVAGTPLAASVVFQVVDANRLPYPGIRLVGTVAGGGTLAQASVVTDETGSASFVWTPGAGPENQLTATIEGTAAKATATALGRPAVFDGGVVSSASYVRETAPGSLASVFGANLWPGADADAPGLPWPTTLAGVQVLVNGTPAPLIAIRRLPGYDQINFQVPATTAPEMANVVVSTPAGDTAPAPVQVSALAPGIFYYPTNNNLGAVQVAGASELTDTRPASAGGYVAIYATGLGTVHPDSASGLSVTDLPVTVVIGGQVSPDVPFSGQNTLVGVYQVNAKVPGGTAPGTVPLYLEIGGKRSNVVNIQVR
jgi:uncharacterized protein (TIGR03437 family)